LLSGIPRAIINFAPDLRRASDETRLTVPRPSPRCPPTFGLVFGFYFFSPSMTTIDCQQLSYESSNNTTTISMTFCAFSTPLSQLPTPSRTHICHHLPPRAHSYHRLYRMDPSFLHPQTHHDFHQGVLYRELGEIDTETGSSATDMNGARFHHDEHREQRYLETCLSSSRYRLPDHPVFLQHGSWTRRFMEPTSCWAILVKSP
ncbi:hypothetical protein FOFC_16603, partial [Fusarium oxysporum]